MAEIHQVMTESQLDTLIEQENNVKVKLGAITDMDWTNIDTYIENNVTNLETAKACLIKLSKAVKALTHLALEE